MAKPDEKVHVPCEQMDSHIQAMRTRMALAMSVYMPSVDLLTQVTDYANFARTCDLVYHAMLQGHNVYRIEMIMSKASLDPRVAVPMTMRVHMVYPDMNPAPPPPPTG